MFQAADNTALDLANRISKIRIGVIHTKHVIACVKVNIILFLCLYISTEIGEVNTGHHRCQLSFGNNDKI